MRTATASLTEVDEKPAALVLGDALASAASDLGLSQKELQAIIGRHRSSTSRKGIDPGSKAGELSLLVVRAHRALGSIVGWDVELMRHWIDTPNSGLGGERPRHLLRGVEGLARVVHYLEDTQARP
jgi:hypothetical protein